jgi:hypothetical protein
MQMVRLVTGFVIVFGLLGLLALFCRRTSARNPSAIRNSVLLKFPFPFRVNRRESADSAPAHLRLLKRLNLTPTHQLHLISTESAKLLICTHPQGCSVLQQNARTDTDERGEAGKFLAELRRHAG